MDLALERLVFVQLIAYAQVAQLVVADLAHHYRQLRDEVELAGE